jgi:hypothetical protein
MSLPYNAIVTGTLCQSSYGMYVVHMYASLIFRGIATGPCTSVIYVPPDQMVISQGCTPPYQPTLPG